MADAMCYRLFLFLSNCILQALGLTVLILGVKMKWALSMLLLINIPIVLEATNAVIATGFFISLTGFTGICCACSDSKWLIVANLVSLGVIVIMEFGLGVTLIIMKKTVSAALESPECNNVCAATIDAAILEYAVPSAGLIMTIIFVEAIMVYSSIKLYFYIRDHPKPGVAGLPTVIQNVQMQNVTESQNAYITTSRPQLMSQFDFSSCHSPLSSCHSPLSPCHTPLSTCHTPSCSVHRTRRQMISSEQSRMVENKPPEYDSLLPQLLQPPDYDSLQPQLLQLPDYNPQLPQLLQPDFHLYPRPRRSSFNTPERVEFKDDSNDGGFDQV